MEEARLRLLSARGENGTALVLVLLSIAILLPPTLVLAGLALRWQRQSIDFRDTIAEESAAQGAFEEARGRLAVGAVSLGPGEETTFEPRPVDGLVSKLRVSRYEDVVLSLEGRILEGASAREADLELLGTDPEGRSVYQYRKIEVYLVEVEVSRRPSLASVRLQGVLGRLSDGSVQVLGQRRKRVFTQDRSGKIGEKQIH